MPNYHRWIDRMQVIERKFRPSSLYLCLLVLVAFTLGGVSYNLWSEHNLPVVKSNTEQTDTLVKQLKSQAQVMASKNLELTIEKEANDKMQQLFSVQHKKQRELERELSFYRSIMAPENNADGVSINGLELTPNLLPRQYRVKLILTQLKKRKQSLKGKAEIKLVGVQDGEAVELDLAKLTNVQLSFKFRYFQILDAEFTLPEGFELSHLKTKVIVPSSRWTKGSQAEVEFAAVDLLPSKAPSVKPFSELQEAVVEEKLEEVIEDEPEVSAPLSAGETVK
ncbi:conserved hypothetical protein [Shewanella sediminis HAW-EB3]|uniref:Uncharacterized protein n=1 Tax=Shewanella sediminis (strain HAW-EB3) TaxID=425104 RepID=A8FS82_SHESH|nr:DUF6776 family protein [Shewanella sediminis]ABV35705.1 conserved hypothetical protein [Shewanella sediminis HAW-EB3]